MKFDRNEGINSLYQTQQWDIAIIGGGATGLGIAADAASRGYKTILLENMILLKQLPAAVQNWCTEVCAIWPTAMSNWFTLHCMKEGLSLEMLLMWPEYRVLLFPVIPGLVN